MDTYSSGTKCHSILKQCMIHTEIHYAYLQRNSTLSNMKTPWTQGVLSLAAITLTFANIGLVLNFSSPGTRYRHACGFIPHDISPQR